MIVELQRQRFNKTFWNKQNYLDNNEDFINSCKYNKF